MLPHGVHLVAQKPTKLDPIPQEGNAGFTRVIYDGGMYRSWNLSVTYSSGSNLGSYSKEHPAKVEVVSTKSNDAINFRRAKMFLQICIKDSIHALKRRGRPVVSSISWSISTVMQYSFQKCAPKGNVKEYDGC